MLQKNVFLDFKSLFRNIPTSLLLVSIIYFFAILILVVSFFFSSNKVFLFNIVIEGLIFDILRRVVFISLFFLVIYGIFFKKGFTPILAYILGGYYVLNSMIYIGTVLFFPENYASMINTALNFNVNNLLPIYQGISLTSSFIKLSISLWVIWQITKFKKLFYFTT